MIECDCERWCWWYLVVVLTVNITLNSVDLSGELIVMYCVGCFICVVVVIIFVIIVDFF